jgi:uncharacterized protein
MATETLVAGGAGWALLAAALTLTGAVAGVLAGLLGVGGGIVIVPVLYHVFTGLGIDEAVRMHLAVGTSLATIVPTSIRSAMAHRARGSLDGVLLKRLLPGVVAGVAVGALASGVLDGRVLTAVFAVVALLVALHMALGDRAPSFGAGLPGRAGCAGLGLGIGGLSTLMGIGGGTLSVPLLSGLGVAMRTAVGTGAALGTVISIPGAAAFVINGWGRDGLPAMSLGHVNLLGVALIVPATLLTTGWGVRAAHSVNPGTLKRLFALFLALTSARMLWHLFS